jgi:phosphopantothenoylcysteine decarboxylase
VLVIAPASANTLAKLAGGLADNLLTCVARAWDFAGGKPVLVAPAMNTAMWVHPLTAAHLAALAAFGVRVVPPVSKALACGDVGVGALAPVADIVAAVVAALAGVGLVAAAATGAEEAVAGGGGGGGPPEGGGDCGGGSAGAPTG